VPYTRYIRVYHSRLYYNLLMVPLTGASNAGGVGTNRDSGRIAIDDCCSAINNLRSSVQ